MPDPVMLNPREGGFLRDDLLGLVTQAGSRQAEGVTQEGSSTRRWLSWGKGVGRRIGKSVGHESET